MGEFSYCCRSAQNTLLLLTIYIIILKKKKKKKTPTRNGYNAQGGNLNFPG